MQTAHHMVRAFPNLTRWLSGGLVTVVMAVMVSCGDDNPAPTPVSESLFQEANPVLPPTPTATPTSKPTPVPTATATATPVATTELSIVITDETPWREVFDILTPAEQSCIRDAANTDLDAALDLIVFSEVDVPTEQEVGLFACLSPEFARAMMISGAFSMLAEEDGIVPNADELACVEEAIADVDIAALIATESYDSLGWSLVTAILGCVPDSILSVMEMEAAELSPEDLACLQEWWLDIDYGEWLKSESSDDLDETTLGKADSHAAVVGGDAVAEFSTVAVTGWMGCNPYEARYSVRQSELRLDDLRSTEAGCPSQALFRQEQRMQDVLATVERFEVSGKQLTLHSESGQVLVFERVGK